jgi:hypothetical protein
MVSEQLSVVSAELEACEGCGDMVAELFEDDGMNMLCRICFDLDFKENGEEETDRCSLTTDHCLPEAN